MKLAGMAHIKVVEEGLALFDEAGKMMPFGHASAEEGGAHARH